jgi:hypothetical protein
MKSSRLWIIVLIILSSMMLACRYSINYQFFEKKCPNEVTYIQNEYIKATTVDRLENGWSIGLVHVFYGKYVDEAGNERFGRNAHISVRNDITGESDSLVVHKCEIFYTGDTGYQVIGLKINTSFKSIPGSSNGYILLGQLP